MSARVGVLQYFEREWHVPQPERDEWVRHWILEGFNAVEATLNDHPATGRYCEGNLPTLADCCLVPQVYTSSTPRGEQGRWDRARRASG